MRHKANTAYIMHMLNDVIVKIHNNHDFFNKTTRPNRESNIKWWT